MLVLSHSRLVPRPGGNISNFDRKEELLPLERQRQEGRRKQARKTGRTSALM